MADHSTIEWTDATWNPVTGCSVVSPGCTNCYAMKLAGTRLRHHPSRVGLTKDTKAGPVWTGEVRLNEQWLTLPLQWQRPRKIFVCAHGDLFAESVPDEWIDRVFAVMAEATFHTFQVLTKRADRMRTYLSAPDVVERIGALQRSEHGDTCAYTNVGIDAVWPLPNVWLGVSAEDQTRYDERAEHLKATPAAVRFFSLEPLLGPIVAPFLADWVIVGGESGLAARPMHPDWARSIRDQCDRAGVSFFFKQWGEWLPFNQSGFTAWSAAKRTVEAQRKRWLGHAHFNDGRGGPETLMTGRIETRHVLTSGESSGHLCVAIGKKRAGRLLDGIEHSEFPQVPA